MRPHAWAIYETIWPGCKIDDLREQGIKVHVLDKEFGIDTVATFAKGAFITLQEKYRKNTYLRFGDFTQEYMNASGTEHEEQGEWFHLAAHLYFYGWANETETGFEKWLIMDVAKYKLLVEEAGGLDSIGELRQNNFHGRATFYSIPLKTIWPAVLLTHHGTTNVIV